jgi:dethiobiotin synthetase
MSAPGGGVFIAGTDTGCGKTRVTVGLLRALREGGIRASGMKPIASGTIMIDGLMINEDVVSIAAESYDNNGLRPALADINPYCFDWPVAPHIAARLTGISIDLDRIAAAYARLADHCERVLVEGTGGWLCPIGPDASMADVARKLALPVVMVVGMRLGCLNHALLTAQAIERAGLGLAGWVASQIEPAMQALPENIDTLRVRLPAPHLATVPHAKDCALDISHLQSAARALAIGGAVKC